MYVRFGQPRHCPERVTAVYEPVRVCQANDIRNTQEKRGSAHIVDMYETVRVRSRGHLRRPSSSPWEVFAHHMLRGRAPWSRSWTNYRGSRALRQATRSDW